MTIASGNAASANTSAVYTVDEVAELLGMARCIA